MKTAVFMLDKLFRLVEVIGRRLRVSRNELYAQDRRAITKRLNDVYSQGPARVDSGLHHAQLKSLEKDAW